jgi:hypothetical protein
MSHRKVLRWVERFKEERTMVVGGNRLRRVEGREQIDQRIRHNRRITTDETESLMKINKVK